MTEPIEKFIYVASPYSHPCKYEMHKRFQQVTDYSAECIKRGEVIYSPIAHNHHMALSTQLPTDWPFWRRIDFAFLAVAKELRVYCLEGWEKSVGVTAEIAFAKEHDIPITYAFDVRTPVPSHDDIPPGSRVTSI